IEVILCPSLLPPEQVQQWQETIFTMHLPAFIADEKQFKSLSGTETPQGIACVIEQPDPVHIKDFIRDASLLIGLDEIRDPGNLGTIIRSADWFGGDAVLLSTGCVEPFNPKVVRATMGSVFRVRLLEDCLWPQTLPQVKEAGFRIMGAVADGGTPLNQVKPSDKNFILLGGEASGISPQVKSMLDFSVTIPRKGNGESLNAAMAASIILYHFRNC
ncbi:MAG TPA: RNA methyltransferase, partial [Planctomycetaceae bacterium]|nr:RNA methyltransferase [Planctomycetaceae bacterium]